MAKIIIPGNQPTTIRRFECCNCGCVFEADEDEYEASEYYKHLYFCKCPCCGMYTRMDDEEV